jgi:UDP-N-acetylglucosamine 1-carboxyvinyltransferase
MLKDKFLIKGLAGKKKLKGKIAVAGAKNAVLPALASSILFKDKFCISNAPEISDAKYMIELLENLGAETSKKLKKTLCIETKNINRSEINVDISNKLRASIILTGPLLARFGEVSFSHPGGCIIGKRPVNIFLDGYRKMGAKVTEKNGKYHIKIKAEKLEGAKIFLKKVSVTGTETLMLAGVLAKGKTILENSAMEPEIKHLAEFLNSCGAKIKGAGTPIIEITGGGLLSTKGKVYKTLPDRIETGSFLILGALSADNLEITNCIPEHIDSLIELLRQSGISINTQKNKIHIKRNAKVKNNVLNSIEVRTHEYPGFATDLQAPMCVFLTQTTGESKVHETIFEGRLNHTNDLIKMGADITMWNPHQVTVKGPTVLRGKELEGPDLRAGLAYVIAGIIAKGDSVVNNVHYIDRGYEKIEERLRDIGVDIKRVNQ